MVRCIAPLASSFHGTVMLKAQYYSDNGFIIQTFDIIARSDAVHMTCSTRYRFLCVYINCMQLQGFPIDSHTFVWVRRVWVVQGSWKGWIGSNKSEEECINLQWLSSPRSKTSLTELVTDVHTLTGIAWCSLTCYMVLWERDAWKGISNQFVCL